MQFFFGRKLIVRSISNTVKDNAVVNQIAGALVERILSAAKSGQKFKVCGLHLIKAAASHTRSRWSLWFRRSRRFLVISRRPAPSRPLWGLNIAQSIVVVILSWSVFDPKALVHAYTRFRRRFVLQDIIRECACLVHIRMSHTIQRWLRSMVPSTLLWSHQRPIQHLYQRNGRENGSYLPSGPSRPCSQMDWENWSKLEGRNQSVITYTCIPGWEIYVCLSRDQCS